MPHLVLQGSPDENLTPVQEFFSGASVLVTGATGFLGKILVDKLLRCCPHISTLYVLVRAKKDRSALDRVEELFDDVVFERLKAEWPKFRHKVVGVAGDCALADLGLSMQDRQLLIQEVSVVFHIAATVRFDEKLKLAVDINVRGSRQVMSLCKKMANLKVVVHVSTAYCNCPQPHIEERLYPPPIDGDDLITLVDTLDESLLDKITPTLLDRWPNTYTYTKAVAEDAVRREGKGLPLLIVRPSIVISTHKEPIRGWISNLYGPTGVCAGVLTGVLRVLTMKPQVNSNVIPVDYCVNGMIAAAWEVGQQQNHQSNPSGDAPDLPTSPHVYHLESSNHNPIRWSTFTDMTVKAGLNYPSIKAIWYFCFTVQNTRLGYNAAILVLHILPAMICDLALLCVGKSPRLIKIYKKIHHFTDVITPFCTREWTFESERVRQLWDKMSEGDRRIFYCDIRQLDWEEYLDSYIRGIRVYLIGDPLSTLEAAKVRWKRLFWMHQLLKALVAYVVVRMLWKLLSLLTN